MVPFQEVPEDDDQEYQDVLELAKADLKELQAKKPKDFSDRFANSVTYDKIVYLGASEGQHSLAAALQFFKIKKSGQLKNLAINISAHGNPELIGTFDSVALDPYDLSEKLASEVIPCLEEDTNLSIYLRTCNSAYINASTRDDARNQAINQTFAGQFSELMSQQRANENRAITVSGYKGFLGINIKQKLSVTQEYKSYKSQETQKSLKTIGAERVRFVFSKASNSEDVSVSLPKNYNIDISGVCLPDRIFAYDDSNDIIQEIPDISVKEDKKLDNLFLFTLILTVKIICDKLVNKDKGHLENSFVSRLDQEVKAEEGRSF